MIYNGEEWPSLILRNLFERKEENERKRRKKGGGRDSFKEIERERGRKTDRLSNSKKPGQTNRQWAVQTYKQVDSQKTASLQDSNETISSLKKMNKAKKKTVKMTVRITGEDLD